MDDINKKMQKEKRERRHGKFLPIGTVVLLKEGKKRIMITGFCATSNKEGDSKQYDYCGVVYPEGVISLKEVLLFNHEQISKIYHMGLYNDQEEKQFKSKLIKMINNDKKD